MKMRFTLIVVLLLSGCVKMDEYNAKKNVLNQADEDFLPQAAYINTGEINLAQLALSTTTDPAVTDIASQILSDHQAAQTDLHSIAEWSTALPDTLNAFYLATRQYLTSLPVASFDTAYIRIERMNCSNAIAAFQTEVTKGSFSNVTDYANKCLLISMAESQKLK